MPSDEGQERNRGLLDRDVRVDRALRAVAGAVDAFHSAVSRTVDEVRSELASRSGPSESRRRRAAELGPLAAGRIDPERWSALLTEPEALDPELADQLREALRVLEAIEDSGVDAFVVRVEAGERLDEVVGAALGRLGRAFGAARTAELIRTGRFREDVHGELVDGFAPERWNRAERSVAPPLVVRVSGAQLRPAGLAGLVDGTQKLVLLVDGAAPPAPLVRLVTPGVLVIQTEDPAGLERIAAFDGPAVAALFPSGSGAARFLHDPAAGTTPAARLSVEALPEPAAIRPVGAWTVAQQSEELAQLRALGAASGTPAGEPSGDGVGASEEDAVQPADRLAAWLLRQANLRDLNGDG